MRAGRIRLALALLLALPVVANAQRVKVDNLPSHVIVDSCSGCGGGGSSSDLVASTTFTGTGTLTLTFTQPVATVGVEVAGGAFVANMFFQGTTDGVTFNDAYCINTASSNPTLTAQVFSPGGRFQCDVAGMSAFRVWVSVYFSGSPVVTIRGTSGAMDSNSATNYLGLLYTKINASTVEVAGNVGAYINGFMDPSFVPQLNSLNIGNSEVGTQRVVLASDQPAVDVKQATGSNLHIVCDSGCGSPPATADGTAFVAGTTNVSPIAAVVDDTATTTVAEDAYGAPRMSTNRVLYADLSKTQANATAIKVDGSAVTQPVSGTVTTTPPSNASTNVAQWNGTTVLLGASNIATNALRVTVSTDQPVLMGVPSLIGGNTHAVNTANTALVGNEQAINVRVIPHATLTQAVTGTFWQATQPVSLASVPSHDVTNAGTFAVQAAQSGTWTVQPGNTANTTAWKVDGSAVTQPVSGTVTTTPPANASTNVAQLAGTTTDTNSGNKSAGTLRVVLATDQPALTNKLLVTPDSVALPANQSVNVNQLAGTTTDTNSGTKSAGTLRVVLATDQPALTNKLLVTPDSVALPANQSVNVNQIAGSATSTAASGVQKVGIVGNAGAALDAANNAAMPANAVATGVQTATIDTSPTAATAGNLRYQLASTEGVVYVQEGGPKRFSCFIQAATVTTQCQAAPAAGLRAYVTSVTMSNQAATVQTLDVVFGTGAACVTATTALTHKVQFGTNATTTSPQSYGMQFQTPLVPTAANAICVRPSAATAFGATITGYIAP